jgi:hypothetical protein
MFVPYLPGRAMATVMQRREFEQDGISFTMLTGLFAIAVVVDAYPSVGVSDTAARLVKRLRKYRVVSADYLLDLAFRGTLEPDDEASVALHESCVYVAVNNLQDCAIANAEAILDEVDAEMPEAFEAFEIATFRRHCVNK